MLFHLPNTLLQKIASEPRTLSSPTRTDLALQMANELFTISKGDRSDKPNVLLVLTDGRPKLPRDEDFDYGILDNINEQLKVLAAWQWRIQGMDPGSRGAMAPLLFLDKNEARRAEKMLGGPPPSPPPPPRKNSGWPDLPLISRSGYNTAWCYVLGVWNVLKVYIDVGI